jgi:hypothetical protein
MNFHHSSTLASEINVSVSDKAKVLLMLLNLLMHLALHHRHLMDHYLNFCMVITGKSGRKTRSTKRIVNTSLSLGLASLLKKPQENVLLQIFR